MTASSASAAHAERKATSLPLVQKQRRNRQKRILGEAGRIITEVGSDALKMNALTARCGISTGSLYQHFGDKGAILSAITERYHAATRDCIETALGAATDWPAFVERFR